MKTSVVGELPRLSADEDATIAAAAEALDSAQAELVEALHLYNCGEVELERLRLCRRRLLRAQVVLHEALASLDI